MAIPKIRELYNPILDYLYQYGESSLFDIRYAMARSFYIPDKEAFNYDGDKPTLFMGRVNNACYNLYFAGLIVRIKRGVYDISKVGRRAIDDEDFVDSDYLWQFPSYQEYVMRRYEQGVNASGPEGNMPLPLPKPEPDPEIEIPIDKPRREFKLKELLTIEDMVKLRERDARFANMIATGEYIYDDGVIKQVPLEVLQHDMSYMEFKTTTLMHSSGQAIMCYEEAHTGKMMTAAKPTIEGYHKTSRGSRPWSNPYPAAPGGGSGGKGPGGSNGPGSNGGTGGYNGNRNYDMVQDMLAFIQQSNRDFNACFRHLMDDLYHITGDLLSQKTGIDRRKIQRMRNDANVHVNVEELAAVMLVLQASSHILDAFIDLIGYSAYSIKYKPYSVICDTMKFARYEDVNDACRKSNIPEVFPPNLSGSIS